MTRDEFENHSWRFWLYPNKNRREKLRIVRDIWEKGYAVTSNDQVVCMTSRRMYYENVDFVRAVHSANITYNGYVNMAQIYGALHRARVRRDGATYNHLLGLIDRGPRVDGQPSYMATPEAATFLRGVTVVPRTYVVFRAQLFAVSKDSIRVNEASAVKSWGSGKFSHKVGDLYDLI